MMDTKTNFKITKNPYRIHRNIVPSIEFNNVSFKYPDTDNYILKNFSLTIKPGEKIAIVGINGAGKTTFVKLLCRFYDPTNGNIRINGIDLKQIDKKHWYSILGILFQDFSYYNFTAEKTISLGRMNGITDRNKILKAAKLSEAHSFIETWEDKYNQMIGKEFDGVELSKGQKQKMAIARVFYRNPNIFILDEPTASIDSEAELCIFDNINKSTNNKTVITISHRFSTVRNSDKICVIDNKTVSEIEYTAYEDR